MAQWSITSEPHRYDKVAERSANVAFGFQLDITHRDGRKRKVNVERSAESDDWMTPDDARRAVSEYLGEDPPPSRLVLTRDGRFVPYR
jgi:hypothetical protein